MSLTVKLKDGSFFEIMDSSYNFKVMTTCYTGILRDNKGTITSNVSYTELEYYNLLKTNNIPIPFGLLRPGDPGCETKDDALSVDYVNAQIYKLKNDSIIHISKKCMDNTYPCQHVCIIKGKKKWRTGRDIARILIYNDITDLGHFEMYK